jgi:hypothetical protein
MRTATDVFEKASQTETDFQIRFRLFVSLLFYITGFLAVSYFIFWRPLLNRWIF